MPARLRAIAWTSLLAGPHAGKTLPQVMLEDPDLVFVALEAGAFGGPLMVEAEEVCRRAARIWPCRGAPRDLTVLYSLNAYDRTRFADFTVVRKSDRRLARYRKFAAAESEFLDLSLPRRMAPKDPTATHVVLGGVKHVHFRDPGATLTREEAETFFNDPNRVAG